MSKADPRETLRQILREFEAPTEPFDEWEETPRIRKLETDRFPVINLLHYGLVSLSNYPHAGPQEKIEWTVFALFRGKPFALQSAKFGPRIRFHDTITRSEEVEILAKLAAVCTAAERCLEPVVADQIDKANFSIPNQFGYLSHAYKQLRKLATSAYRKGLFAGENKGSIYAGAMLDAYFSRLEHFLVLCLPFVGYRCDGGALQAFIRARWSRKFKEVFDCAHDKNAMKVFEKLNDVKEQVRNVLSHGAMQKDHGSLWVHVPGMSPIPAHMNGVRKKLRIAYFLPPIMASDFRALCKTLDESDTFVRSGKARFAWDWVDAGLQVRYDAAAVAEIEAATHSPKVYESLINKKVWQLERDMNMDY